MFRVYSALKNRFHIAWSEHSVLLAAATGPDRIWFAPTQQVANVHLSDATFAAFKNRALELEQIPLLIHDRTLVKASVPGHSVAPTDTAETRKIMASPPSQRLSTNLVEYETDRLAFVVDAPEDGYVLVTDRWASGWEASVNDHKQPVLGGNFIFRAVAVKKGVNRIEFRYCPFGYPWLFIASWGTLGLVGMGSLSLVVGRCCRDVRMSAIRGEVVDSHANLPGLFPGKGREAAGCVK